MFQPPEFNVADIVRNHKDELERRYLLPASHKRVLTAISRCRTDSMGAHLEYCPNCDREVPVYNSCRNRHCPICQAWAQEEWIRARAKKMLPVSHFHLVFTVPPHLRPVALRHPEEIYGAIFNSVRDLVLELAKTRHKCIPGVTMVLHTWNRKLELHPHLHVLVSAGGLSLDRTGFVAIDENYLFPVRVMGQLLRGKVLDGLRTLQAGGAFPELSETDFNSLMGSLARYKRWITYAKAAKFGARHVLSYLGRYVKRVAIANSRLISVGDDHVTFRVREGECATLHPVTFLRRFLLHVLPGSFHKVRHAGLYACAQAGGKLEQARALLAASHTEEKAEERPDEKNAEEQPDEVKSLTAPQEGWRRCPYCGTRLVLRKPLNPALAPAPPRAP